MTSKKKTTTEKPEEESAPTDIEGIMGQLAKMMLQISEVNQGKEADRHKDKMDIQKATIDAHADAEKARNADAIQRRTDKKAKGEKDEETRLAE